MLHMLLTTTAPGATLERACCSTTAEDRAGAEPWGVYPGAGVWGEVGCVRLVGVWMGWCVLVLVRVLWLIDLGSQQLQKM